MAEAPLATPDYVSACVRVGDFDVTYLAAGEGPETVILLHGYGAWSEVAWRRTLPALAPRYRVIAPDLIGFGLSSKPGRLHFEAMDPLESEARFLGALMDALGVEKATLVGSSFGGAVALRAARLMPERVTRLVLVNAMGLGRAIHYAYKALAMPVLGARLAVPHRKRLRRMWRALVADPSLVTDDVIERNFELLSDPGAIDALLAAHLGVNALGQKFRLLDVCPEVEQPTLLVWGERDRIFPVRHARRAARRFPRAELVVFDRCGHLPSFECPDRFNAALLAFLATGPARVDAPAPVAAAPARLLARWRRRPSDSAA